MSLNWGPLGRMLHDELVMRYPLVMNYPIQSSAEDVYGFRDQLRKYGWSEEGPKMGETFYVVTDGAGNKKQGYTTEAGAIAAAESYARACPGQAYFVTKTIAKSFVAPSPSITTRL